MQLEIFKMLDHARYGLAIGYATASIAVGYCAIWATTAFVRRSRLV